MDWPFLFLWSLHNALEWRMLDQTKGLMHKNIKYIMLL